MFDLCVTISFLADWYSLKTTDPNKIITALKAKYIKYKKELEANHYFNYSLDNLPEETLDCWDTNEIFFQYPDLYRYLQEKEDLEQLEQEINTLSALPFKSYPIVYAVLVPVSSVIESTLWNLKPLVYKLGRIWH
jgi:hypothetical protein